jgi:hypothetical protein
MVTDRQVRKLRTRLEQNETLSTAAAAAGMTEKTARRWRTGPLPSKCKKKREWRTRPDPFAEVWEHEVVPLLESEEGSGLQATELLGHLREKHPDLFSAGHVRTLQRRLSEWRTLHGPGKEVFFEQEHVAGREGSFDFTSCDELQVTIARVPFAHLLFEFVLSFSKWRNVSLAYGETYEAMLHGLQEALWELPGVPEVFRSDNLSAATHELRGGGRDLTRRYREFLEHYGARSTRIRPGKSHENGVAEKAHDTLKTKLDQALRLRGSRDFESVEAYMQFVRQVVDQLNRDRAPRLREELPHLKPLPSSRLPEYTVFRPTVRQWSTIHFANRTYSVPSRLIGKEVEVRQHADVVEVWYAEHLTATMPRLRKEQHRIDYRHVIWSLVRKPGAFARYKYREELFPTSTFRRAYDALVDARGERADVEYVRILHLAASTMESRVDGVLATLLESGQRIDYATVKQCTVPDKPTVPHVSIPAPSLRDYDQLLVDGWGTR